MTPSEFLSKFGPYAMEAYQEDKTIFASTRLAQLIQELGWSVETCTDINTGRDSLNLFNIKGDGPAGHVSCKTWEVYNGVRQDIIDDFRAYNNYSESFADHAKLLLESSWYEGVRNAQTPEDQCGQLQQCGYATDPSYADSLINLINQFDLKQFDVLPPVVAAAEEEAPKMAVSKYFDDVPATLEWAVPAIDLVKERGLMIGIGERAFNPTGYLTRAESAVLMNRVYDLEKKLQDALGSINVIK